MDPYKPGGGFIGHTCWLHGLRTLSLRNSELLFVLEVTRSTVFSLQQPKLANTVPLNLVLASVSILHH